MENLKILDLHYTPTNDIGLQNLAKSKYLRNLVDISLSKCANITNRGFDDFVKKKIA